MSEAEHDPESEWLAERYAAGKMSESEEEQFEALLLGNPQLVSHVAAAHGLRMGFIRLQHNQTLDRALRPRIVFARPYALAAALLICVIGVGALLFSSIRSGGVHMVIAVSVAGLHLPAG